MKKHLTVAALAATAGLALSGCSGEGGEESGPVELVFWHGYTEADGDVLDGLIAEFNELHDDIEIRTEVNTWAVINDTFLPALSAGDGPDLIAMGPEQIAVYAARGALQDLDQWRDDPDAGADTVLPAALETGTVDGSLYALPLGFVPITMFYNTAIFAEAGVEVPVTWDEWTETASQLTVDENGDGTPERYGIALQDHQTVGNGVWASLLQSGGGGIIEDGEVVIDSPENAATLAYWSGAVSDLSISPTGLDGIAADGLFSSGAAAMTFGGPWMATIAEENGIEYGIAPLPAGPGGIVQSALGVNAAVTSQADEAQRAAAETFFSWFFEPEQATEWSLGSGWPPVTTDVGPGDVAENEVVALLAEQTQYSVGLLPGVENSVDVLAALDELTQRAMVGEDIPALLEQAQEAMERAVS